MIMYNIKIILRYIWNNKSASIFSVLGLALGLAVFLYVFMYCQFEYSYDKSLKDAEKTYRIYLNSNALKQAKSFSFLGKKLSEKLPVAEDYTTFIYSKENTVVEPQSNTQIQTKHIMAIDSNFVDFFGFKVLQGEAENIIKPNTAIITQRIAKKYFGKENPIGKALEINSLQSVQEVGTYTVVAVVEDVPQNIHFTFNILLSQKGYLEKRMHILNTHKYSDSYTYLKIKDKGCLSEIENYSMELIKKQFTNYTLPGPPSEVFTHSLQPIVDIHLKSTLDYELKQTNTVRHLLIYLSVGFVILIISLLNFIIIHSTSVLKRGKEIAYRKISGGTTYSLLKYFSLESLIYCFIAFYISIILIELFRPLVLNSIGIDIPSIYKSVFSYFIILFLAILIIIVFDIFMLFLVKRINLVDILKLGKTGKTHGEYFRKILTIIQFAGTICLLIFAFSVLKQLRFIQSKDLGFSAKNKIILTVWDRVTDQKSLKQELKKIPGVNSVARCQQYPTYPMNGNGITLPGGVDLSVKLTVCDEDYFKAMNVKVIEKFNYTKETLYGEIFINEKFYNILMHSFDNDLEAILSHDFNAKIAGVVNDFNYTSLHEEIGPFFFGVNENTNFRFIILDISSKNRQAILNRIEEVWSQYYPNYFFDYTFLDDKIATHYNSERLMLKAIKWIITIILLIISIGLVGTISLTMKSRRLEIGMKKVLGANTSGLIKHYLVNFYYLLIISFIIACIPAYYYVKDWYSNFYYRAEIQVHEFIFTGLFVLIFSSLIIMGIICKSVNKNPVDSLRYE